MKKYRIVFHPDAETDIASLYQWESREWGEGQAQDWVCELSRIIKRRLRSIPLRGPLSPESEELGIPVRQLIVRRYRILFIVEKTTVTILHIRGPYIF